MGCADDTPRCIRKQNRKAIGRQDRQDRARKIGHGTVRHGSHTPPIADPRNRSINFMHDGPMNLGQPDRIGWQRSTQACAICLNRRWVVSNMIGEIQTTWRAPVEAKSARAHAAMAGRKKARNTLTEWMRRS